LDYQSAIEIVRENFWAVLVKIISACWRIGVLAFAVLLLALSVRRAATFASMVLWVALLHAIGRTAFLGWGFFIESRYLLEIIPLLEIAVVISAADQWRSRSSARNSIRGTSSSEPEISGPGNSK
jgi:hypothetical protein